MLAVFILATLTVNGYLLYNSTVTPEEVNEMLRAEEWY